MAQGTGPDGQLRVFVAAQADSLLAPLLSAFEKAGVDAFTVSDVAPLGADVVQALRAAIESADLVLVMVGAEPSPVLMFGAGMATVLGKRVIVSAEGPRGLPSDLNGVVTVVTMGADPGPVVEAVQAVARYSGPIEKRFVEPSGQPLDPTTARRLLARVGTETISESDVVDILVEAINGSGAVAVQATGVDRGWDIGVWADDLTSIGANPMVVEIKRTLQRHAQVDLHRRLSVAGGARIGLLVHIDDVRSVPGGRPVPEATFPLLVISLRDLLEQMTSVSFARVVRDLRNRAVHVGGQG